MGITKFVLKRPVTAILAVLCLIVFGIVSVTGATLELSPDTDMSMMIIMTNYSGASPEDVAELVTKPIEDSVSTLSGLKTMSSTSSDGMSMIMMEYDYGTDMDEAYDDLKKKVDQVASMSLPDDCSTPTIVEMNSNSSEDISLMIENEKEASNLYNYVENTISPEFEKLSDVADVTVRGGNEKYVSIELAEDKMKQYGVTMTSIAQDIKAADTTIPAGDTKDGSRELSVSTRMNYDTVETLKNIPLTTNSSNIVYLSDVAVISYTAKDSSSIARYDGNDTITIGISKQQSASAMTLSSEVKEVISSLEQEDSNLHITVISDSADSIQESLSSVVETLILAIIISMAIIWLFFGDLKASLIVGSSIPTSILAALILMRAMDFTLNIITLSALTLGVGMMVDNSIVVLESCFRITAKYNQRPNLIKYAHDALDGTHIVTLSVVASTATTCVVFLPLAMLNGMVGQMFKPLGFTIVFCMVASLISAITVVPLCYMLYKPKEKQKAPLNRPVQELQDSYRALMRKLLKKKKTVLATSVVLLIGSCMLATTLKMELMSSDDQGNVSISIEMRPGTTIDSMETTLAKVEEVIKQDEDLEHYRTEYSSGGMRGSSSASISAELKDDRTKSTKETATLWKQQLADITNCSISVDMSSSMSMMSSAFNSYEVILQGADYDEVKSVTSTIIEELKTRDDVAQVHSNIENAAPIVEVSVDAVKAKANGLTSAQVGNTLYSMLSGSEATTISIDGEDVSVMLEYPDGSYDTLNRIKNILLTNASGGQVVLTDVADVHYEDSPSSISRKNKQYQVTISAQYQGNADANTENEILSEVVKPNLTSGVSVGVNSMNSSMNEEFSNLFAALAEAVFLIFVVMAAQFESPKYSLMVMTTIPFSLIGSFSLLWLTNVSISMVSLVGFLMLIGTAVNNGILYVDTVNQYRETMDFDTALIEAGATRMRPILMTTLTTVISMIPMAFAIGNAGSMTQGLAIVNIGGLTASTILCLLMLPVYYSVMTRKKDKVKVCEIDE